MKFSVIDMVQEIMSDMSSDEVNSISDTAESEQVSVILRSTYLSMMANRNWPHQRKGFTATGFADPLLPTHVKIPDLVKDVILINYDVVKQGETKKKYTELIWKEPDSFIRMVNNEDSDKSYVQTVTDSSGIELLIRNDRAPRYYTSFNDQDLVFDAFDSEVDTTIQESKIQAMGYLMSEWTMNDSFVPDLPDSAFPSLIEEAKSRAALKLNQEADQKSEQESVRQRRWLARTARKNNGGIKYPNYGRSGRRGSNTAYKDPTFERR